jgi:hypothetical protein
MAHFAELNENDIVLRVIVLNDEHCKDVNGNESEVVGQEWLSEHLGGTWIQTSYNHNIRGNFAGIGFHYLREDDRFVVPQPFPSWTLNRTSWTWEAPTLYPNDGGMYKWVEDDLNWQLVETAEDPA